MKAQFINPFITSATEVLQTECHVTVHRDGKPSLSTQAIASQEVTAIIGVTGKLEGVAVYSMSYDTALALFSEMMGEPVSEFDDLARSAIGELGNMITGRAATLLEKEGYSSDLSPPTIVEGKGTTIRTLELPKIVLRLNTEKGDVELNVGLREARGAPVH